MSAAVFMPAGNGGIALELVGALRDCLEIVWVLKHGHLGVCCVLQIMEHRSLGVRT